MDYEQKYKEILAWARKNKARLNGVPIEDVLPELAESEDEKVKKDIINLIYWLKGNPSLCSQYYKDRYDGILAWLEKQKENPKSADSIPLNCVSDAKCDDRWHKVADFLPDSGRDVLAKDALGNYLLASFDGDQWFVNVYDGEDKPIVYTPAIKEWCDIPSEKQKEPHYTKRNALFDKCVENCDPKTVEEVNKRVDDIMNMPELSAFEQALTNFIGYWEDDEERWPSQFVKKHGKHILDMAREELQKEQKPVKPAGKLSRQDYLYQLLIDQLITYSDYEYLIGQKPADLSEMMVHKEPYIAPVPTPMVADEQKPAEWSEKYIADVFEKVGLAKIVREQGNDALTNAVQSAMLELSKVGNAEWSDEDEENFKWFDKFFRAESVIANGRDIPQDKYLWFKSLHPQPKVEWSEEDEERIQSILFSIGYCKEEYPNKKDYSKDINWLKSLRPSWKPSEDDIKMLEHIIGQYETGNKNSKVMGYLPRVEELNFLKKVLAKWKNLL